MLVGGFHLILDLGGCHPGRLNSPAAMMHLCRNVAGLMGARLLNCSSHQFNPKGVTAFAVIEESHISIHTWPESGKAFFDVFTCQSHFDSRRTADFVIRFLGANKGTATLLMRRGAATRQIYSGRVSEQEAAFSFGATIFEAQSNYQHIELTKGPLGLSLFLDGYWQFVERYEHIYHEMLVHPALAFAPGLGRVGIAGGGDGLALREVVKYGALGRARLCEIDPLVLALADGHPEMLRLNRRSLRHPKAQVKAGDARLMLHPNARFDALILDFPSISDGNSYQPLYSAPFYRRAKQALAPDGVLVTQVTDYPWHFVRATRNLRQVFPYVIPIDIGIHFSLFNFVLASRKPFRQHRRLPEGLRFVRQSVLDKLLASPSRASRLEVASA